MRDSGEDPASVSQDRVSVAFARLIEGLPRFPAGDSRARLRALVAPLTPRLADLDAIKAAGSNGKGSVVAMVSAILEAAGVQVAAFFSPHVRTPAERVLIEGVPLEADRFVEAAVWARDRIESHRAKTGEWPGIFEAILALSLHAADRARVETLVVEAGIGGRLDPTGIVAGALTGLVSVDLEHTKLLGDTLEAIARDKADLADDGSTLVVGDLEDALIDRVREHVAPRQVDVVESRDVSLPECTSVALAGAHQAVNARLAACLAREWLRRHRPRLDAAHADAAIRQGLSTAALPGRLQRVATNPDIWVDVAHTPRAVAAVARAMRQRLGGRRLVLVVGVSEGRDPEILLAPLQDLDLVAVFATRARRRGADPARVVAVFERAGISVSRQNTTAQALDHAVRTARGRNSAVLVTGSFFLAAEALALAEV